MIDTARLLADLTCLRADLEDDLRGRCADDPELDAFLQGEHRRATTRERTAETYESWREEHLTQVAVAWILGCGFVRFLEDNVLVDPPRLCGPGDRRKRALDEHNLYFRAHPTDSDREYLLHVFRAVATLPVAGQLFDEEHNPIWSLEQPGREFRAPSGDAATRLLGLWQRIDPDSGALAHDFTDPAWDTRFLGDLYQDLSESEREADPSLVIGWAGWNALEQSRAVAAYFTQMREQEGWTAERLTPLLTALLELLPWVRQYHNAPDPEFDTGMGDYFEGFIDEEARALSLTRDAVRAWTPPAGPGRRGARRRSSAAGM